MIKLLLTFFFFLFLGCSDDESGYDVVDVRWEKSIEDFQVNSCSLRVNMSEQVWFMNFENANTYHYDQRLVNFVVDSVLLRNISDSFETISSYKLNEHVLETVNYWEDTIRTTWYSNGTNPVYNSIVVFDIYISNSLNLKAIGRIKSNSTLTLDLASLWKYAQTKKYVEENGYPLNLAFELAEKEYERDKGSAFYENIIHFLAFAFYAGNDRQEIFDELQSELYSFEGKADSDFQAMFLDSTLKYFYYLPRYMRESVISANGRDTIQNENSLYNGDILNCDNNFCRIAYTQGTTCDSSYTGSVTIVNDTNILYCTGSDWVERALYEKALPYGYYENHVDFFLDKIVGPCVEKYDKANVLNRYFWCNDSLRWGEGQQIDYDVGFCGKDYRIGTMTEFADTLFFCAENMSWETASEDFAMLYRDSSGGNCSKKSKYLQLVNDHGWLWMCVERPSGKTAYGWKNISETDTARTEYIQIQDSIETIIYGDKLGNVMYLHTDSAFNDFYNVTEVYDVRKKQMYQAQVFEDCLWLASAAAECPSSFDRPAYQKCTFPPGYEISGDYCTKKIQRWVSADEDL